MSQITDKSRKVNFRKFRFFPRADVEAIDFDGPNGAADLINAWCANVTDNHLTNIISQEDAFNSNILLLNAIYYEGVWQHPFPETQTTIMDFSINQNEVIIFPFITQAASYFYTETVRLNSKILRLPYEVMSIGIGVFVIYSFLILRPRTGRQICHVHCFAAKSRWFGATIEKNQQIHMVSGKETYGRSSRQGFSAKNQIQQFDQFERNPERCETSHSTNFAEFHCVFSNFRWEFVEFSPVMHLSH